MSNMNPLARILDSNRLTGLNYVDWLHNLKTILNSQKIGYVLDTPVPDELPKDATKEQKDTFQKWHDDELKVRCYILASMSNELQCLHEKMDNVFIIINHLQEMYGKQIRTARYEISRQLFQMRMIEGTDVNAHVLKMIDLMEQLESLNFFMDNNLQIDLILHSLPDSFFMFKMNFCMNNIECTLVQLLNMLIGYQEQIRGKGNEVVHALTSTSIVGNKLNKKNKNKKSSNSKLGGGVSKKKGNKNGKGKCFHCKEDGHLRKNCPKGKGKSSAEYDEK